MIDVACVEVVRVSEIKVDEKGKSATILNPEREPHNKVKVDGCVITDGPRADWVIEREDAAVIVELKGRNVEHGADQVFGTATQWKEVERRCQRIAGLIVGRQTPGASTAMQVKKKRFAARFKGPLHVVSANSAYKLESILSFKGPFRE